MAYMVFNTPEHYYLYDREISRMTEISQKTYEIVLAGLKGQEEAHHPEVWENLQKHGFCKESQLQDIEHPAAVMMEYHLNRNLGDLVLQVTQGCNLRCGYCVYSGKYYNRTHSSKRMTKERAFQAVDFFVNHAADRDYLIIGFYGGEPLLEFQLIQDVIQYTEENHSGKKFHFNMTTNATLLTDEVADYLVEKDFSLTFSLVC